MCKGHWRTICLCLWTLSLTFLFSNKVIAIATDDELAKEGCAISTAKWPQSRHACDGTVCVLDDSYADDTLYFACHEQPRGAIAKFRRVAEVVHKQAILHGLLLNFQHGKSEITMALRGKGARAVAIETGFRGGVSFKGADGREIMVPLANKYKHVGTRCCQPML